MWINRILNVQKFLFWHREVIILFIRKIKQIPGLRKAERYFGRDDSEAQQCHSELTFSLERPQGVEWGNEME